LPNATTAKAERGQATSITQATAEATSLFHKTLKEGKKEGSSKARDALLKRKAERMNIDSVKCNESQKVKRASTPSYHGSPVSPATALGISSPAAGSGGLAVAAPAGSGEMPATGAVGARRDSESEHEGEHDGD
jgi:hypothetical protein